MTRQNDKRNTESAEKAQRCTEIYARFTKPGA